MKLRKFIRENVNVLSYKDYNLWLIYYKFNICKTIKSMVIASERNRRYLK